MLGTDLISILPTVYGVDVNAAFICQFAGRYLGYYFFDDVAHWRVIHQSMYFTQTFYVLRISTQKVLIAYTLSVD